MKLLHLYDRKRCDQKFYVEDYRVRLPLSRSVLVSLGSWGEHGTEAIDGWEWAQVGGGEEGVLLVGEVSAW